MKFFLFALCLALASPAEAKPKKPTRKPVSVVANAGPAISKEDIIRTIEHSAELAREAQSRAEKAGAALDASTAQLLEAGARADKLQGEIEALASDRDAQRTRADEATKRANHQTALAWKWRLITAGLLTLVAAFFIARQYLPFLKFI